MATLDYDVIAEKAMGGLVTLNEQIVVPKHASSLEALIFTYIDQMNSGRRTVMITDPYLFASSDANYVKLIINLLRRTNAKRIKLYMPKTQNNSVYAHITSVLSHINFEFKDYSACHDRFWLCSETQLGFIMGTSLNGLGKRICRIDMLIKEEVKDLLTELWKVT